MERTKIAIIHHRSQHTPIQILNQSPLGMLGAFMSENAAVVEGFIGDWCLEKALLADVIIITGAMESVYNKEVDWVPKEARLIEKALQKEVPLIGICFGAQHIAKILGGQVYKLPKPILRLSTVRLTDAGLQHPVFDGIPSHFRAISLHQDHFTLPASCEVLAQTREQISAFCHGNVIGFQFHPELTALHLSSLLRKRVKLAFVEPNVIEDSVILQNEVLMNEQMLANQARTFAKNILEFVEERV